MKDFQNGVINFSFTHAYLVIIEKYLSIILIVKLLIKIKYTYKHINECILLVFFSRKLYEPFA